MDYLAAAASLATAQERLHELGVPRETLDSLETGSRYGWDFEYTEENEDGIFGEAEHPNLGKSKFRVEPPIHITKITEGNPRCGDNCDFSVDDFNPDEVVISIRTQYLRVLLATLDTEKFLPLKVYFRKYPHRRHSKGCEKKRFIQMGTPENPGDNDGLIIDLLKLSVNW